MTTDSQILRLIAVAEQQTECVEQRTIKLLYESGCMSGLICDEQRTLEARVRELLLTE